MSPLAIGHLQIKICQEGFEYRVQHQAAVDTIRTLEQKFTAYGDELKRLEVFTYLGSLLAYDDNDVHAVRVNLKKEWK